MPMLIDARSSFRAAACAVNLAIALLLNACGGGNGPAPNFGVGGQLPSAASLAEKCQAPRSAGTIDPETGKHYGDVAGSVADEKAWLRAWTDETYLWYGDVRALDAAVLVPTRYATPIDYFAVLKSPLKTSSGAQKDRFHFTEDTAVWQGLANDGASIGYGAQFAILASSPPRKTLVVYTQADSPASRAGVARGSELLSADGVDAINADSAADITTLNAAVFPQQIGRHSFTFLDPDGAHSRTVTLLAQSITEASVLQSGTLPAPQQDVGYIVFNHHFATAESELVKAIGTLQSAHVSDLVLDMRYNGGGLLDIASELAYMIAGPAQTGGKFFSVIQFNDRNPFPGAVTQTPFYDQARDFSVARGTPLPHLDLKRVYVLSEPGTCSASEAVINGLRGVDVDVVQIGGVTCGKPYGFFPQDNCSTTYFSIQMHLVNAKGFGDHADGIAPTCPAADDLSHALGDPNESLLADALTYRATGSCAVDSKVAQTQPALSLIRSPMREIGYLR